MSTRNSAWAVTGGVSLLLAVACGGENIRDVGDVNEGGEDGVGAGGSSGGSDPSTQGGTGSDAAGTGTGGLPFIGAGAGGLPFVGAGTGGLPFTGGGNGGSDNFGGSGGGFGGGPRTDCFAPPNPYNDPAPTPAPENTVFVDAHSVLPEAVKNSAEQQVFTNIGVVLEAYANFSASTAATDSAILLPSQLSQVAANLGQFYLARPSCAGKPAAGHKVTVEFWWKMGAAVTELPTHGVALGTVSSKGKAAWFEDSAKTFVTGDAPSVRLLNTLNRLVVQHTFAENDETDAGRVTLGVWLLPDAELPTTFYIGKVQWD